VHCTASAAGEDFVPYFHLVVDTLKVYLVNTQTEDQRKVQIQAVGKSYITLIYALEMAGFLKINFCIHFSIFLLLFW